MLRRAAANLLRASCLSRQSGVCVPTRLAKHRNGPGTNALVALMARSLVRSESLGLAMRESQLRSGSCKLKQAISSSCQGCHVLFQLLDAVFDSIPRIKIRFRRGLLQQATERILLLRLLHQRCFLPPPMRRYGGGSFFLLACSSNTSELRARKRKQRTLLLYGVRAGLEQYPQIFKATA